jgi:hypothetical protein
MGDELIKIRKRLAMGEKVDVTGRPPGASAPSTTKTYAQGGKVAMTKKATGGKIPRY